MVAKMQLRRDSCPRPPACLTEVLSLTEVLTIWLSGPCKTLSHNRFCFSNRLILNESNLDHTKTKTSSVKKDSRSQAKILKDDKKRKTKFIKKILQKLPQFLKLKSTKPFICF